eukprot:gene10084-12369_t
MNDPSHIEYTLLLPLHKTIDTKDDIISFLVQYNDDVSNPTHINSPRKTCCLCKSNQPSSNFTSLLNCNHLFCTECLSAYVSLNIEMNVEIEIICPDSQCGVPISQIEIMSLVSKETYDQYKLSCEHCSSKLKDLDIFKDIYRPATIG